MRLRKTVQPMSQSKQGIEFIWGYTRTDTVTAYAYRTFVGYISAIIRKREAKPAVMENFPSNEKQFCTTGEAKTLQIL